jgi:transcriptional regulator with XRE-family HTH domain
VNKAKSPDSGDAAVGPRIRARRLKSGLSQQEIARRLGITYAQVQKYENGKDRVTVGRLSHISDILGVSITVLLTGALLRRMTEWKRERFGRRSLA